MSQEGTSNAPEPELVDLTLDDETSVVYDAPSSVVEDVLNRILESAKTGQMQQESPEAVMENEIEEVVMEEPEEVVEEVVEELEEVAQVQEDRTEQQKTPESLLQDADALIIEETIHRSPGYLQENRRRRAAEFLNWFLRLKPEQFDNLNLNLNNYVQEAIGDMIIAPELCSEIAKAFLEDPDLKGLAEKFQLKNEEMVVVALCICAYEERNLLEISFTSICDDRIDEWTLEKICEFLDQPTCCVNSRHGQGPLKLLQYTITTPVQCILALTITWLQNSRLPCRLEFADLDMFPTKDDIADLPMRILENVVKNWNEQPKCGGEEMTRNLDEFHRELGTIHAELNSHLERLKRDQPIVVANLQELLNEPSNDEPIQYLTEKERAEIEFTTTMLRELKSNMEDLRQKAAESYESKHEFIKLLKMLPGDYCLARQAQVDTEPLKLARVVEQEDRLNYRVKFVESGQKEFVAGFKDLAIFTQGLHYPGFVSDSVVGLRVAVCTKIGDQHYWLSGTIADRHHANNGEFLVFLDNGIDEYFKSPVSPGMPGYDTATRELVSGEPWVVEDVKRKIFVQNIVLMLGQAVNEEGKLDRFRTALWHRDATKACFIRDYMRAFPEWPLLRMPPGMRFTVFTSITNRQKNKTIVLNNLDRVFATIRYVKQGPGGDCVKVPCWEHTHRDEKIYRGSNRLEVVAQTKEMLTANNNLSRRRKDQFASQFEPTELERPMPIRKTHSPQNGPQSQRKTAQNQKSMSKEDKEALEVKKVNEVKFKMTKLMTPVLKPLEELKWHDECGPDCLQDMDSDPYDSRFHQCSPLHTPLMSGWRRSKISMSGGKKRSPWKRLVIYHAPCGKPLQNMAEIAEYLLMTRSQLTIDCFCFDDDVETETYVTVEKEYLKCADFAKGLEGIPIPVVNSVDAEEPPVMEYCKKRFQYDDTVNISSINKEFCTGCSCEGDCSDADKCECQQLSIREMKQMPKVVQYDGRQKITPHYVNRSLYNKVLTGMYECNDQCQCNRSGCHNRVVQNGIKYPMQIFKTAQSGWGVRALTDIPEGAFICNYIGALLTNELADQLKNDDQYFADLDLKDSVEFHKIREDNETDFGYGEGNESDFTPTEDEESDGGGDNDDKSDKPLVMRNVKKGGERNIVTRGEKRRANEEKKSESQDRSSTESSVEKPAGVVFNWDEYFKDSALFVVDAKQKGNLGRFLNHSCDPNVQVQHVMYDTHDLRLPWVAFFTTKLVKAGEELCWDYAYTELNADVQRIKCYCGSANCRVRLL